MKQGVDAMGGKVRYLARWMGFILLVALAGLVLACGNAPVGTSVDNTAVSGQIELLERSFEKTKELKSFRARLDMKMKLQGQDVPMSFDMDKSEDDRVRMVMDMQTGIGAMELEMIMAEGAIFAKLPGAGWVRMDAGALAVVTGQPLEALNDPTALYDNLFPSEDVPWELYEIASLGSEVVDGVQTKHLSIQMDFAKILDQMDKETREQISQSSALGGLGGAGALDQVDVTKLEVWIDDAGYNRRTIMEVTLGADTAMVLDMRMFDFDQTISIELPENVNEFSFP